MALLRNLSHRFHSPLLNPHSLKTQHRSTTSLPKPNKKPLHAIFTQALKLSENTTTTDDEDQDQEDGDIVLKRNLKQLEKELRTFKDKTKRVPKNAEKRSLYAVFTNQQNANVTSRKKENKEKPREPVVIKKLSPEVVMFVQYLYEKGYFKDANFVRGKQSFDLAWFESFFARGYIKFAALKFARDNQEIAKWLSGSALKQVAMFGCPSINRSCVISAKKLRKFFEVPENTVCSKCSLRESCKFVNQDVWNFNPNNLDLVVVMKVITSYALEFVPPQLVVPEEVNNSVSKLLEEVVVLSQTT